MKTANILLSIIAVIGIAFTLLTMKPVKPQPEPDYPLNGAIKNSDYVPAQIPTL